MRPQKKWEDLTPARQRQLRAINDPRVPADYVPRPVGRPQGMKLSLETRRKISAGLSKSDEYIATKVARATKDLLEVYGSVDAIIEHLRR